MFDTIQADKRLQCSSEFGLYRCDSDDEFSMKKNRFNFHYFVVLLTSVIVLSAICVVTYTYVTDSKKPTEFLLNSTISSSTNSNVFPEPSTMELRANRRIEDPRPFIYEIRDPKPVGFRFPNIEDQNSQAQNVYSKRHTAKNIQEIIKLLEQSQDDNGNSLKKKKTYKRRNQYLQDPFFPYKPQNPSDINLLATTNFRFAPSVQMELKKPIPVTEYPKYEKPIPDTPISLTLDVQNNQQYTSKRHKQKNLYNQNAYFNPVNNFHQNRQQPYWNRPYWSGLRNRQNAIPSGSVGQPMVVHLNLYPKKKKKNRDQRISESNLHENCTDWEEDDKFNQIRNATEFNQLLEKVRHNYLDKVNDNELYQIKNTILQLNTDNSDQKFNNQNDNIEIQKSIGFTIVNPNFSTDKQQSPWRPMLVDDNNQNNDNNEDYHPDNFGLEVGEVNDNANEDNNVPVTLPLPNDLFQKYFNTKPTPKIITDWDWEKIKHNPNLANHRPHFEDGRDE